MNADEDEGEIEDKDLMENDASRESSSTITLDMLMDEIQKMNQTLLALKQDIEGLKNDVSHIRDHIEEQSP